MFYLKLLWVGIFKFDLVKFFWIRLLSAVDTGIDSDGLSQEWL